MPPMLIDGHDVSRRKKSEREVMRVRRNGGEQNVARTEDLALLYSQHDEGCTILMFMQCAFAAC